MYVILSIFFPAWKDFRFSLIIFMFVVFCSGDVVLESLASCCESATPCDTPGGCFPIPGESSGFRLCCVMITTMFPWPPTQQNNSQVFVVGRLILYCRCGFLATVLISLFCMIGQSRGEGFVWLSAGSVLSPEIHPRGISWLCFRWECQLWLILLVRNIQFIPLLLQLKSWTLWYFYQ